MKDRQNSFSAIYSEFIAAQKFAYVPSGLISHNFVKETEGKEHRAFDFEMNNRRVKFRVGKITPTKIGQFVFPKAILQEKGIVSKDRQGGKRAMRIYPPWDITENQQAKSTQAWQLLYFFEIPLNASIDIIRIQQLFFS